MVPTGQVSPSVSHRYAASGTRGGPLNRNLLP